MRSIDLFNSFSLRIADTYLANHLSTQESESKCPATPGCSPTIHIVFVSCGTSGKLRLQEPVSPQLMYRMVAFPRPWVEIVKETM